MKTASFARSPSPKLTLFIFSVPGSAPSWQVGAGGGTQPKETYVPLPVPSLRNTLKEGVKRWMSS